MPSEDSLDCVSILISVFAGLSVDIQGSKAFSEAEKEGSDQTARICVNANLCQRKTKPTITLVRSSKTHISAQSDQSLR